MIKKRTPREHMLWQFVWMLEGLFILIVPIYLYGWLKGLLIHSALSSLLHIAGLLSGNMPRTVVEKDGKVMEDIDVIKKEAVNHDT
jgi:hypothetical protein